MESRESGLTRRQWFLVALAAPAGSDQTLLVRRDGDHLRVSAPQIRFLTGKPLEQLRNGNTASFACQVTLTTDMATAPLVRAIDRFVVSYDLWEEKFSAIRVGPPRRSVSRLNQPATEAWCLDQTLAIPASLTPLRRFSIRLELRVEEGKDAAPLIGEPGINIMRLIELFSRPPRAQQPRWLASAGPLKLADLK